MDKLKQALITYFSGDSKFVERLNTYFNKNCVLSGGFIINVFTDRLKYAKDLDIYTTSENFGKIHKF